MHFTLLYFLVDHVSFIYYNLLNAIDTAYIMHKFFLLIHPDQNNKSE
jgi:hypothetical protein